VGIRSERLVHEAIGVLAAEYVGIKSRFSAGTW